MPVQRHTELIAGGHSCREHGAVRGHDAIRSLCPLTYRIAGRPRRVRRRSQGTAYECSDQCETPAGDASRRRRACAQGHAFYGANVIESNRPVSERGRDNGFQKRSNEANGVNGERRQGHGELLHGSPLEPGLRPGWRVGLRSQETQAGLPVGPLAFPGILSPTSRAKRAPSGEPHSSYDDGAPPFSSLAPLLRS